MGNGRWPCHIHGFATSGLALKSALLTGLDRHDDWLCDRIRAHRRWAEPPCDRRIVEVA